MSIAHKVGVMSSQLPTYVGDTNRRITVELPRSFEDLEHLCLTSFGMVGPVTLYRNGTATLTAADYGNIRSGDNFVVVDSRGNALDMKDFFVSTYDSDFKAKPLPPRQLTKVADPWRQTPDNRTFKTTEDDYQAWPVQERKHVQPIEPAASLPFSGVTEYDAKFTPHKIPPRSAEVTASKFVKVPDNRNFSPESSKYKAWDLPKRQSPSEIQRPATLPFKAKSSYQQDFVAHELPEKTLQPSTTWKPSKIPFQAQSTAQSDYRKWDIPTREMPHRIARPPTLPFNATTTAQDDYRVI